MTDPIRDALRDRFGVDDPASARDLPAPRLRFELADAAGIAGVLTAVQRAAALAALVPEPIQLRIVCWGEAEPPVTAWFPDRTPQRDDAPTADGAPRRTLTFDVRAHEPGITEALAAAFTGAHEIDLWFWGADRVLLRPYDDRGADVASSDPRALAAFARAFPSWLLDASTAEVRCTIAACTVAWADMAQTASATVRRCSGCRQDVHLVATEQAFAQAAAAGRCVALPVGAFPIAQVPGGPPMPPTPMLAGAPMPVPPRDPPLTPPPAPPPDGPRTWLDRLLGRRK